LLENAKNIIIGSANGISSDKLFITFIKDYASQLDKMKNEFMKLAGIDIYDIYNLVPSKKDHNKIINRLMEEFKEIVKERY